MSSKNTSRSNSRLPSPKKVVSPTYSGDASFKDPQEPTSPPKTAANSSSVRIQSNQGHSTASSPTKQSAAPTLSSNPSPSQDSATSHALPSTQTVGSNAGFHGSSSQVSSAAGYTPNMSGANLGAEVWNKYAGNAIRKEDSWRAVGSPARRNSQSQFAHPSGSSALSTAGSQISSSIRGRNFDDGPGDYSASASQAASHVTSPMMAANNLPMDELRAETSGEEDTVTPLFQYFGGGRNHGQRSFSFSVGQPSNNLLTDAAAESTATAAAMSVMDHPPPGFGGNSGTFHNDMPTARSRSRSQSYAQILSELPPELVEEMLIKLHMQQQQPISGPSQQFSGSQRQAFFQQQQADQQKKNGMPGRGHPWSMSDSFGSQHGPIHRRASTFTSPMKSGGSWSNNDMFGAPMPSRDVPQRRYSHANEFSTSGYDTQEIATRYFNRDPALLERRHSIAAAMAARGERGLMDGLQQLSLKPLTEDIPDDFVQQYGSFLDHTLDGGSPHPLVDENRTRSWSEPSRAQPARSSASPSNPLAESYDGPSRTMNINQPEHMFVVEFKGGRADLFYVPDDGPLLPTQILVGDLVIVEADRGKDLGKVIVANVQHPSQIPVHIKLSNGILGGLDGETAMKTGNFQAKCIYRLAQPIEVNMLLDKARDESKALAICQAKVRQKALPMEVVDAEYQWDRRKLTFFFVAEKRIDFRELVRDLFKIYKTRIWMCAVERSRPAIRLT